MTHQHEVLQLQHVTCFQAEGKSRWYRSSTGESSSAGATAYAAAGSLLASACCGRICLWRLPLPEDGSSAQGPQLLSAAAAPLHARPLALFFWTPSRQSPSSSAPADPVGGISGGDPAALVAVYSEQVCRYGIVCMLLLRHLKLKFKFAGFPLQCAGVRLASSKFRIVNSLQERLGLCSLHWCGEVCLASSEVELFCNFRHALF
eukprot:TRINITY_DN5418_c0_g1_i2.p1 TRINITY_DN5418_c0_g1~~TRINITY_DN5418_c0_g1_i2.p1  ORF type:complete len:204 (+),score=28.48 TRINITY_DN5418_c0_g1_i2:51-662(+)